MKSILGIIASPRRLGNCELMVKEVSRTVSEPHDLRLLRLSDLRILPCKACYRCLGEGRRCPLDDDLGLVLDEILGASAFIVAAPAYMLGANGTLKMLQDRGLSFYARVEELWGKPSVGLAVAGIEGKEGATLLGVESFLAFLLSRRKATAVVYGALPGEVLEREENRVVARELGQALTSPPRAPSAPARPPSAAACSHCGGDSFRFLGSSGSVRCLLCSAEGRLDGTGEVVSVTMYDDDHPLFQSRAAAVAHREWLVEQVGRFRTRHRQLRALASPYRDRGTWVEPPQR